MANEVKPYNVTDIVLTWSGEKFVNRPISWSNFAKTDILAALMKKTKYHKSGIQIKVVSHDKGSDKNKTI